MTEGSAKIVDVRGPERKGLREEKEIESTVLAGGEGLLDVEKLGMEEAEDGSGRDGLFDVGAVEERVVKRRRAERQERKREEDMIMEVFA